MVRYKVFVIYPEDVCRGESKPDICIDESTFKCGSCNWYAGRVFVLARSRDEAIELVKRGLAGLCAECFLDLLIDLNVDIETKEEIY